MAGPSRRRPWPFDAVLNGTGVMLGRSNAKDAGPLVITKPQTTDTGQPLEPGIGAQNPANGRDHVWDDMSLGYGLRMQIQPHERRYYYAIGVDLSVGGLWMLGPRIYTTSPAIRDTDHGITRFADLGGVVYAMNGRYMLQRSANDTWGVNKDFGVGNQGIDCITYQSNASGALESIYVAMGDATPWWRYDLTNGWVQRDGSGGSSGSHPIYTRAFGKAATWLYVANNNNHLAWVDYDSDPFDETTWIGPNPNGNNTPTGYTIGTAQQPINRLAVMSHGGLLIFKPDGVYTLDSTNIDRNLYESWGVSPDSYNGMANAQFMNDIYVSYRDGVARIHLDYSSEEIGPNRLTNNDSDVSGRMTAFQGHDTFNLYGGMWNDDSNTSYIMKFGAWLGLKDPPDWIAPSAPSGMRIEAWHGSISQAFYGKKITAMHKTTIGAPAGHSRLYVGFSDGTIAWFTLACTQNPLACSAYEFSDRDGLAFMSSFHGMYASEPKSLNYVTMNSNRLDSTDQAQFLYRTDWTAQSAPTSSTYGSYQNLTRFTYGGLSGVAYDELASSGTINSAGVYNGFTTLGQSPPEQFGSYLNLAQYTYDQLNGTPYSQLLLVEPGAITFNATPTQTYEFPQDTSGTLIDAVVLLKGTTGNTSPVLRSVGMNYAVRPSKTTTRLTYQLRVLADTYLAKRNGTRLRMGVEDIRALVQNALWNESPIELILPDETTVIVGVQGWHEEPSWDERLKRHASSIVIDCAQYAPSGVPSYVYGDYERLAKFSYARLALYNYQQLTEL